MSLGRVLVIEDELRVGEMLIDILGSLGYEGALADTGVRGLQLITSYQPDVVLLDYYLPGMSGAEVLAILRRDHPAIPVVMVTANQDEPTARKTLDLGAFDYVRKPFDVAHFSRVLQAAILYRGR
jgi:CheY-like chemotaxis protein